MTLEQLRASLREKHGALGTLKTAAFADDAPEESFNAYEQALKDLEAINRKIDLLEREEEIAAKAAKPVTAPAGEAAPKVPARAKTVVEGQELSLIAAAIVKAGKDGDPTKILIDDGYEGFVDHLKAEQKRSDPTSTKAVNTLVSSEGGILVPAAVMGGGIMPILRAQSTFINANPVRVTLVNGKFTLPRGLAGASASYVAEGALKPVSTPTFDAVSMLAKKLAGIVPITNEARMWTVGDIEAYVRQDLRAALAVTLDLNGWLGTGAGSSPLGILNKSGVQTFTPTFADATAPTLAELDAFATGMILKLTAANLTDTARWRWVMPYRTASALGSMRVGDNDGDLAFPEMAFGRAGGPLFKGIPVIVTAQIPTNLGVGTDETTVALVDFNHVLFGEEEGIVMKMSDQATLNTTGATNGTGLVHLWQQNMFAILAEAMHDFGLRTALAVVKSTAIQF
jgi:HK97 family phage major capsid protein